jgi:hypothetical protein
MATWRFSYVGTLPGHPDYGREISVTKTANTLDDARKLARNALEVRGNWRCFQEVGVKDSDCQSVTKPPL